MRKVLSFVLVLSLVLGSFSMAFAAEETKSVSLTDLKGKTYEEAANSLVDLGVITGMGDGTFGGDKEITRAQMAAMICKALGLSEAGANTFKDAKNHWAKSWIGLAQSLGVITGYADGTFKPDANVTYYEALAMIIKALGYDDNSLTGTWPNKYITQAQRLGISDDVTISAANANRGDIATMVYNSLGLQVGTTNKDGDWVGTEKLVNNVKTPVTLYTLLGATTAADRVILGTEDATISLTPFVGKFVTPIENKDGDIIAIKEVKSTTIAGDTKKFDGTSVIIKDKNEVEYIVDASTVFADGITTAAGVYILNGYSQPLTLSTLSTSAVNATSTFEAKTSGNKITYMYSAVKWSQTRVFKYATGMLDGAKLNGLAFDTEKDGKTIDTTKFQLKGVDSLDKIAKDSVVSVYCANNNAANKVKMVEVGTKTIEGKVTAINSAHDKYTIAGTQYSINTTAMTSASAFSAMALNSEVKVSLDFAGKIAFVDEVDTAASNYAVFVTSENASNIDSARVKLLTADGSETVYPVKSTVTLAGLSADMIVNYSVNKDGKVDSITSAAAKIGKAKTAFGTGELSSSRALFGGNTIASNVVVFTKSTSGDYDISKLANIKTGKPLSNSSSSEFGYFIKDGKVQVMFLDARDARDSKAVYAVINNVSEAIDKDGDEVQYAVGLVAGKEFKGYTDSPSTFANGSGDLANDGVYELDVDSDGIITAAKLISGFETTNAGIGVIYSTGVYSGVTINAINTSSNLVQVTGAAIDKFGTTVTAGDWVAVDSHAVVYAQNNDGDWEVKAGGVGSLVIDSLVTLLQVDEDSEQYDIILVW